MNAIGAVAPRNWARPLLLFVAFMLVMLTGSIFARSSAVDDTIVPLTKNQPPSLEHPMGTNGVDADQFSQVLVGSRKSVVIATVATIISLTVGTLLGLAAALSGRWGDILLMRHTDVGIAVPRFLVVLAVTSISPTRFDPLQLALLIGLTGWFDIARLIRGEVAGLLSRDWVLASRALGTRSSRLAARQLFPHLLPILVVMATLGIGRVVVLEAGLSYLGAGTGELSLGSLLKSGFNALGNFWWLSVFPGVALLVIVLACNAVGDALRDIFAPEQVHA